jgi:hypothetical protein
MADWQTSIVVSIGDERWRKADAGGGHYGSEFGQLIESLT